jgi:hypothetical protein
MGPTHWFETAFWIFFGIITLWILFGIVQMLVMREERRSGRLQPARKKGGLKSAPTSASSRHEATWGISGMSASDMQVGVPSTSTLSDLSSTSSDSGGSVSYEVGDTGGGDSGGGDFSGGGGDGGGGGSSGGWND